MKQNMRKFRRGEISRVSPQKGVHTDVHFGAPAEGTQAAAVPQDAAVVKLTEKVAQLEAANAELRKAKAELDGQHRDGYAKLDEQHKAECTEYESKLDVLSKEKAKLSETCDELRRQLAEQPQAEPVNGLRVIKVLEVSETDGLLRIDCELKPTSGPLGSAGAIILPASEVDKLLGEDNAVEDENEDDEG
jgi:hypothetical protein